MAQLILQAEYSGAPGERAQKTLGRGYGTLRWAFVPDYPSAGKEEAAKVTGGP